MAFFNEKKAFFISNGDFDAWVEQNFGQPYEVMVEEEAYEEAIVYEVTGRRLYDYDLKRLEEFKNGGGGERLTRTLLEYAVSEDWLESGTYVIEVGDG